MGMYEIPRNVKGERKIFNDIFYKSIDMDSNNGFYRINILFDF